MMTVSSSTIQNWYHRWQADGLEGFTNRQKSGHSCKAYAAYVELQEQVMGQDLRELGFAFTT
jgi:transposase